MAPEAKKRTLLTLPSYYRVQISFLLCIGIIIKEIVRGTEPRAYSLDDHMGLAGLVLVVAGAALRSWSAGIIKKAQALATTGPYALTRHPLYVGSGLLAAGLFMIIGSWENIIIIAAAVIILYIPSIRREERVLAEKFGEDWDEYVKQTGIICKKLSALRRLGEGWSVNQWLDNQEYRCAFTAVFALVALALWRMAVA